MNGTKDSPEIRTVTGEVLPPIPPKINLSTIDDVRLEMARVYRDMRSKDINPQDGTRLTYVLAQLESSTKWPTSRSGSMPWRWRLNRGNRNEEPDQSVWPIEQR